jgi:hypothetical protein
MGKSNQKPFLLYRGNFLFSLLKKETADKINANAE